MPVNRLFVLLISAFCLLSCHYRHTEPSEHWDLTRQQRDSMAFAIKHHYSLNYNFIVVSDSIRLLSELPIQSTDPYEPAVARTSPDTFSVMRNENIVVADIVPVKSDSTEEYWIKVAHDQETMGWIPEKDLLLSAIPCDPISRFIHAFSNRHLLAFFIILGFAAGIHIYRLQHRQRIYMVHFNDIQSIYPTCFCLSTATAAMLYGSLQTFVPETWVEFYYHPTLNPFGQPFILSAFLTCVWLMLITGLAAIDDVRKQLRLEDAVSYLFSMACISFILYLFFTLTTHIYIGYPFFAAYAVLAVALCLRHNTAPYLCGNCGQPLKHLGRCPHCGAINK